MPKKMLIISPGPNNIPEKMKKLAAQDMIHPHDPLYTEIVERCLKNIKKIAKTKDDSAVIIPSSSSGAFEMIIASLLSPGDEIILIKNGYYADWVKMFFEAYEIKIHIVQTPRGDHIDVEGTEKALKKYKNVKAIAMLSNETSSGVVNDVEAVGKLSKKYNKLLLVDAISGFVLNKFEFSKWNVDAVAFSSLKSFVMQPGIGMVVFSKKALRAEKKAKSHGLYLKYSFHDKFFKKWGCTPATLPINNLYALDYSLQRIIKKGLPKIWKEKKMIRQHTQKEMEKLGFETLVNPKDKKYASNSVLCLRHPKIKNTKPYTDFLYKKGIYVANGSKPLTYKYVRLGFMGDVNKKDMQKFIDSSKAYLKTLKN